MLNSHCQKIVNTNTYYHHFYKFYTYIIIEIEIKIGANLQKFQKIKTWSLNRRPKFKRTKATLPKANPLRI